MDKFKRGDYLEYTGGKYYIEIVGIAEETYLAKVFDEDEGQMPYILHFSEQELEFNFDKIPEAKYKVGETFENAEPDSSGNHNLEIIGKDWIIPEAVNGVHDESTESYWLYIIKVNDAYGEYQDAIHEDLLENGYRKLEVQ